MSQELFIASILNGITGGFVKGMEMRTQKEQAASDAAYKQALMAKTMSEMKTPEERELEKRKTEADILKSGADVEKGKKDTELDLLKYEQKNRELAQTEKLKTKEFESKQEGRDKREEEREKRLDLSTANAVLNQKTKMMSDQRMKGALTMQQGVARSKEFLRQIKELKSGTALSGLGISLAKALGEVGQMTEKDVTRYTEAKGLAQKAVDKAMALESGGLSQKTIQDLEETLSSLQKIADEQKSTVTKEYVNGTSAAYKVPKDEIQKMFGFVAEAPEAKTNAPESKTINGKTYIRTSGGWALQQ